MEFIKDELFKPELLVLVDEDRLQNMGISLPGGKQVKFFKEIEVIKARLAKEKEEQEKNAPAPVGPTLTKTASAQEIKANVMAQSQDLSDTFKEKLSEVSGEIDANELEYTKELGAGASGKVYKARWREKEVAVKVLSNVNMDAQIEEFKKEFKIMNAVKSPFMIQFYGASLKPLMMVMEFCARGSLYHVLNDKTLDFNWDRALNIAIEMANGIAVLHGWEPQIVHRDLKSLNLLVTSDWKIKVADFGLSRFTTGGNMETFKKLCGTFAYCAPEIFGGTSFTDKSDVYSMGMVVWELIIRVIRWVLCRAFIGLGTRIDLALLGVTTNNPSVSTSNCNLTSKFWCKPPKVFVPRCPTAHPLPLRRSSRSAATPSPRADRRPKRLCNCWKLLERTTNKINPLGTRLLLRRKLKSTSRCTITSVKRVTCL